MKGEKENQVDGKGRAVKVITIQETRGKEVKKRGSRVFGTSAGFGGEGVGS